MVSERIYEIGRIFVRRFDPTHMQEFTMIEWYVLMRLWTKHEMDRRSIKSIATDVIKRLTLTVYDNEGNAKK